MDVVSDAGIAAPDPAAEATPPSRAASAESICIRLLLHLI